jgi:hypothetical protein
MIESWTYIVLIYTCTNIVSIRIYEYLLYAVLFETGKMLFMFRVENKKQFRRLLLKRGRHQVTPRGEGTPPPLQRTPFRVLGF